MTHLVGKVIDKGDGFPMFLFMFLLLLWLDPIGWEILSYNESDFGSFAFMTLVFCGPLMALSRRGSDVGCVYGIF